MRILGIDPGYAIVGWGVIETANNSFVPLSFGAITTDSNMDFNLRLQHIYDELEIIIKKYKPDAASIEKLYFQTNQKTAIMVAEARGVILLALKKSNVDIFEYTPLQVKSAITGYGKANKSQMMEMTKKLLRLKEVPKPDDTADALAIAICHSHTRRMDINTILKRRGNRN